MSGSGQWLVNQYVRGWYSDAPPVAIMQRKLETIINPTFTNIRNIKLTRLFRRDGQEEVKIKTCIVGDYQGVSYDITHLIKSVAH